jgi:hypothetical protein
MKTNAFLKTALLTTLSAAAFAGLFHLSGCTDILGIDTDYTPMCKVNFEIEGPDEIFIDPGCKVEDITYELFADGNVTKPFPDGSGWDLTWKVTGGLTVASATDPTPLVVTPPNDLPEGVSALIAEISVNGKITDESCGREGDTKAFATKSIQIFRNVIKIKDQVESFNGGLGKGVLTIEGDKALGDKNYEWSIFPEDAAVLTPQPGTPFCNVANAKQDFTVQVFKKNADCAISITKEVKIKMN